MKKQLPDDFWQRARERHPDQFAKLDRAVEVTLLEGADGLWRRLHALTEGKPFLAADLAAKIRQDFQLIICLSAWATPGCDYPGRAGSVAYWLARATVPAGFELRYEREKEYAPGTWQIVETVSDLV